MALNEIKRDADSISVPVDSTVVSSDLVAAASGLVGVAETSAKPNEAGDGYVATVRTVGVFDIPVGSSTAGIGEAVEVTLPTGNVFETVTLIAEGTGSAAGTVVAVAKDGTPRVALNK